MFFGTSHGTSASKVAQSVDDVSRNDGSEPDINHTRLLLACAITNLRKANGQHYSGISHDQRKTQAT